jgi:N-acetylneuraminic acid mutarotase
LKRIKAIIVLFLFLSVSLSTTTMVPCVLGAEDSWTTMEPLPTARSSLGVAVVDGKICVMGGSFGRGSLGNNEVYDPLTNSWTNKTSIPTPRIAFGIATVENKIYVIGGSPTGIPTTGVNEVYDPETDTWETKTPMPTSRTYVVANEVDRKIYVMAGCTFPHPSFPTLCNKTEVYDSITDSWTEKAQMPDFTGLGMGETVASAVIDNTIYVTVGETLHIYSTENDSWNLGASVPTAIYGKPAMGATTGESAPKRLYLFGGWGDNLNRLNLTQVYNPEENVWSYAAQMPTPRSEHAVAVLNDQLYVIGGSVGEVGLGTVTNLNEQYTPLGYIPEFPSWIILPLFFVATLVVVGIKRKVFRPT